MKANKSQKRTVLLETIIDVISHKDIYDKIDYVNRTEDTVKQFMYQPLLNEIIQHYINNGVSPKLSKTKAEASLKWEGNKKQTMHNMVLFGTQHRPDMEVEIDGIRIAIEVKKGNKGADVRAGFGQCLVYSTNYDFVVYLFVDTNKDKKILNSVNADKEQFVIKSLWDNHNSLVKIV